MRIATDRGGRRTGVDGLRRKTGATGGLRSRACQLQVPQPDQVIRRGGEGELPIHEGDAAMPELAQAADGLHPPEDLLHELPFPLTDVIARMRRVVRPSIALQRAFWATWGVRARPRTVATKLATS